MTSDKQTAKEGEYALATGEAAVHRLMLLHKVCSPAGRRVLLKAGLRPGMCAVDFGCGIGAVTRMIADMVGPAGSVTGLDASGAQLAQAREISRRQGYTNVSFIEADACASGLARDTFDLAYCRFLLLHLPDPAACLQEMRSVLRPGGLLVVEDGDLARAGSVPPTALDACADLWTRLGPKRGVDYSLARNLREIVRAAGFAAPEIEEHHPTLGCSEDRSLLKLSVQEAGPAFVAEGLITADALERTLAAMETAAGDPDLLVFGPRMSAVWARKSPLADGLAGGVQ
jgi:SAM-dependent methyltransferase